LRLDDDVAALLFNVESLGSDALRLDEDAKRA
jgi:hypothetical protein